MRRSLLATVLASVFGFGCQVYDFEKVTPFAVVQSTQSEPMWGSSLKPNLMLLVDQSGSMLFPIDPSDPRCTSGCGPGAPCPAGCPTRITELKSSMSQVLTDLGTKARMGLTVFPAGNSCQAPTATLVPIPASTAGDEDSGPLSASAGAARAAILAIDPTGGTPTGAALGFLSTNQGLDLDDNRHDYVLLLTDGLPNCNEGNANQMCSCNAALCGSCASGVCAAQISACACQAGNGDCSSRDVCAKGCLDQTAAVGQVASLNAKGIKTVVVGFGALTGQGTGPTVLNAMAEAGGYGRDCPKGTNAECGTGNRCLPSKRCEELYYQAGNGAELSAAIEEIVRRIVIDVCTVRLLTAPPDIARMAVIVDGQHVPRGASTWMLTTPTTVEFFGQTCADMKAATQSKPIDVQIRIVEEL
jgi:hypothetical protein